VSGKPEREYGQTWKWGPPICKSCVEGVGYVAVSWQVSWKDTQAVTSRKLDGKAPPPAERSERAYRCTVPWCIAAALEMPCCDANFYRGDAARGSTRICRGDAGV
jgi:hypothetical protein